MLHFVTVLFLACLPVSALEFDPEVPTDIQQQVESDLALVASIAGRNPSAFHQQVFGAIAGASYKTFFENRVSRMGMGQAIPGAVAFFSQSAPRKIWLTENYLRFSHPAIARLMVLFHEARHAESTRSSWPHVLCPEEFNDEEGRPRRSIWSGIVLAGFPGCDTATLGAYGITVVQLGNIAKSCTNCSEKVLMDASLYGNDQKDRIVNPSSQQALIRDLLESAP